MPDSDFARWLSEARAGSEEALGRALQACRGYLLLVAERELDPGLRAKGGASDLVQQTILDALQGFDDFRGSSETDVLAWLRQILHNNVRDFGRWHRGAAKRDAGREVPLGGPSDAGGPALDVAADTPTPSQVAMDREDTLAVHAALERLPEEYRRVIVLRAQENRPFDEIGRLMNRSENAAQKLFVRAIERLQQELKEPP